MKKLVFVIPLIALSLLVNCNNGGGESPEPDPSIEYCVVGFDTDGGSYIAPKKVEKGKTTTAPDKVPSHPSTEGETFTFSGWDFDFECTPIIDDITIKAIWNKSVRNYTVTFNTNGGELDPDAEKEMLVPYGTKFSEIEGISGQIVTKEMHLFNGWALTSTDQNPLNKDNDYIINDDLTVYAILVPQNTVTLTFNGANCHLYRNGAILSDPIKILKDSDNVLTLEPDDSYFPVFLEPVTSTGTETCEYNPFTKKILIRANKDCTVTASTTKKSIDECTWAQIKSVCDAGLATQIFKVGDEKNVTLLENGKEQEFKHTIRIIDFYHDDVASGEKATITFEFKTLISKTGNSGPEMLAVNWNDNTDPDHSLKNYNYHNSSINYNLNETTYGASVINMIPNDLRQLIKPIYKLVAVNEKKEEGKENYVLDYPGKASPASLFLLSYNEITNDSSDGVLEGEGTTYQFYKDHDDDKTYRIKKFSEGYNEYYWLRSPYINQGDSAWRVGPFGGIVYYPVQGLPKGIAPAFCI